MAKAKDFLWNGDLATRNGDFLVGFSDRQHLEDIAESSKGHYKEFPSVGLGLENYLNSRDIGGAQTEGANQLTQDGYTQNVQIETLDNGQLIFYGERPDDTL